MFVWWIKDFHNRMRAYRHRAYILSLICWCKGSFKEDFCHSWETDTHCKAYAAPSYTDVPFVWRMSAKIRWLKDDSPFFTSKWQSLLTFCRISLIRSHVYTSDGQIQIMIWFKLWLNHLWWFDLSTKDLIWKHVILFGFDFILCDLIWRFEQTTTFSNLGQGIMITLLV